ncbi:MAG: hypothetical protein IRZ11_00630 [Clostridia bacterium]|nr:hypothetical protein [Clostridia bacterium]
MLDHGLDEALRLLRLDVVARRIQDLELGLGWRRRAGSGAGAIGDAALAPVAAPADPLAAGGGPEEAVSPPEPAALPAGASQGASAAPKPRGTVITAWRRASSRSLRACSSDGSRRTWKAGTDSSAFTTCAESGVRSSSKTATAIVWFEALPRNPTNTMNTTGKKRLQKRFWRLRTVCLNEATKNAVQTFTRAGSFP